MPPSAPSSAAPTPAAASKPVAARAWSAAATVGFGLVALAACLLVFGTIAEDIHEQEAFALDAWATPFLHGISSPGMDLVMNGLTTLGSGLVIVPGLIVAVALLLWRHRPGAALFLGVVCTASALLNEGMKLVFQRPRPVLEWAHVIPEYSFPSGHTMNSLVFYLGLALVVWSIRGRRAGILASAAAIVLAIGIGISRIYLGHHYLTDVVGGFLAGLALLLLVATAMRARPAWREWRRIEVAPEGAGPAPD